MFVQNSVNRYSSRMTKTCRKLSRNFQKGSLQEILKSNSFNWKAQLPFIGWTSFRTSIIIKKKSCRSLALPLSLMWSKTMKVRQKHWLYENVIVYLIFKIGKRTLPRTTGHSRSRPTLSNFCFIFLQFHPVSHWSLLRGATSGRCQRTPRRSTCSLPSERLQMCAASW